VAEGSGVGRGGSSDSAKWNRGEDDAFRAGGDDMMDTLTAIVGKGWVKMSKSAIPVRGPSVAVVRGE
jgi:hypothetical protein